jgi:hypothetical protein
VKHGTIAAIFLISDLAPSIHMSTHFGWLIQQIFFHVCVKNIKTLVVWIEEICSTVNVSELYSGSSKEQTKIILPVWIRLLIIRFALKNQVMNLVTS